ncbi:hypothetical protein Scep_019119 [Stephania cephalantha]|uniref:Uncharacterized protein n=1 Tax=Stephania cephalantha TaxID=152367 RepID=A0AAP0IAI3_9MAGN
MARSKAVVTRKEIDSDPLGGARGRGGPRRDLLLDSQNFCRSIPTGAFCRRCLDCATDPRLPLTERKSKSLKPRDLMIARGGSQGEAFESSEDSLGNEEREEVPVVEATEGHKPHEAVEEVEVGVAPDPQQMKKSKKKTRLLLYLVGQ